MCQVWFHAFSVKSNQGSQRRPKGILQCMSIFPSPHPFSSCKLKKALKLPSHRYLPTPTTFHFLPPPYIFVLISPSSLLFQAISPSSLLCTSPLTNLIHKVGSEKRRESGKYRPCDLGFHWRRNAKSKVHTLSSIGENIETENKALFWKRVTTGITIFYTA